MYFLRFHIYAVPGFCLFILVIVSNDGKIFEKLVSRLILIQAKCLNFWYVSSGTLGD